MATLDECTEPLHGTSRDSDAQNTSTQDGLDPHHLILALARALARQAAREDDAAERGDADAMLNRHVS